MNIFDTYTHNLLIELNKLNVQYIIVGGYAVNYHGYRRTTGDIDIWVKPDNGINKKNIIKCLRNLKVAKDKLKQLAEIDFTKPVVFIDGEEPFKIDFMTHISGVKFNEAWEEKIITVLDGIEVPFIHLNHLVLSKITTGRAQDKIDIEILQKIQRIKNTK